MEPRRTIVPKAPPAPGSKSHFEVYLSARLSQLQEDILAKYESQVDALQDGSPRDHAQNEDSLGLDTALPLDQPEDIDSLVPREDTPRSRSSRRVVWSQEEDMPEGENQAQESLAEEEGNELQRQLSPAESDIAAEHARSTQLGLNTATIILGEDLVLHRLMVMTYSASFLETELSRWGRLVLKMLQRAGRADTIFHLHDGWDELAHLHFPDGFVDLEPSSCVSPANSRSTLSRMTYYIATSEKDSRNNFWAALERRCLIHPNSRARMNWILLTAAIVAYESATAPVNLAFDAFDGPAFTHVQSACVVFWTIDLILTFFTGIYIDGILHMHHAGICKNYLKGWFLFDLVLVLFDWYDIIHSSADSGVSTIRISRMLRMLRLLRVKRLLVKLSSLFSPFVQDHFLALTEVVKLALAYLLLLHVSACFWFWFWLQTIGDKEQVLLELGIVGEDSLRLYTHSLQRSLGFLLGCSTTKSLVHRWELDLALDTFMKLSGLAALSYLFASTIWIHNVSKTSKGMMIKQACVRYLCRHNISRELATNTLNYVGMIFEHSLRQEAIDEETGLLNQLPRGLQLELRMESFSPTLIRQSFFAKLLVLDEQIVFNICHDAIKELPVMPSDTLFLGSTPANNLLFVVWGHLQYVQQHLHGGAMYGRTSSMIREGVQLADLVSRVKRVSTGDHLCEAALWTRWLHAGKLTSKSACMMLALNCELFRSVITRSPRAHWTAQMYARKTVHCMNQHGQELTDMSQFNYSFHNLSAWMPREAADAGHLMFISHYKVEAGTEAVLMHEAIHRILAVRHGVYSASVFLDTENLDDLGKLHHHVAATRNFLFLLSPSLLHRPWCLVELVLAVRNGVQIVPVEIQRPGMQFKYPDEKFYARLRAGDSLSHSDLLILASENIELEELEDAIRRVFELIAVPFSPHKSASVRDAEVATVLERCDLTLHAPPKNPDSQSMSSQPTNGHSTNSALLQQRSFKAQFTQHPATMSTTREQVRSGLFTL
eukprot:TRINITY_DN21206_c0_g1_i1.p1 TRINITY_DN21206_c0_g1~~TRINITY_DN21206_c0_g1_i1.p1  ORF type:complete len:1018 (+),score=142.81 TRINITY_DN21206_c0_g1_i1:53-3055(+)